MTDVWFLHAGAESQTPTPPPGKARRKASPRAKKGSAKKPKKQGNSSKDSKEQGFEVMQRKLLMKNYLFVCAKLKTEPLPEIIDMMSLHENVQWTAEQREEANSTLDTFVFNGVELGPCQVRALVCSLSGQWICTSQPLHFSEPYTLLKHLALKRAHILASGAASIASLLKHKTCTLTSLRLYSCAITANGCCSLAAALQYGGNKLIQELRLDGDETIGDRGLVALSAGLASNKTLRVLSLSSCGVTAASMLNLGNALGGAFNKIKILNLECNNLRGLGIQRLMQGLVKSKSITVLNLASASVSETDSSIAITAISSLLQHTKQIEAIDFNINKISDDAADSLAHNLVKAVHEGSSIKEFIVSTDMPSDLFLDLSLHLDMKAWKKRVASRYLTSKSDII